MLLTARSVLRTLRENQVPMVLYTGTTARRLSRIRQQGFHAPSYWGTQDMGNHFADYWSGTEAGGQGVIIAVPLATFTLAALKPDMKSITTPLSEVLEFLPSPEEILARWEASAQDWLASYEIAQAVVYTVPLPWPPAARVDIAE